MTMQSHIISSNRTPHMIWRLVFWTVILVMLLLVSYSVASGQCVSNPTNETAVGLQNASSFYLSFYIDGVRKGAVPAEDKSVDFVVTPGEHTLFAEAVLGGETVSVLRTVNIPKGYVCTWTITDPPADSSSFEKAKPTSGIKNLLDSLRRKPKLTSLQERSQQPSGSLGSIVWKGL
jgi:hypothetical protein